MHATKEGTRAPCLHLPLCLRWALPPQRMHAAPARSVARCHRTCPRATAVVAARYCCAYRPAPPATTVRMRLRMHMGATTPALLPPCTRGPLRPRGPPLSVPRTWSCNIKHLLQHTSKTDETFTNIRLQHLCMATAIFR
jgi:hypothetical protein